MSCTASPPAPPPPPIDAEQIALRLEAGTRLSEPARIFFRWALSERDARFRGRGVARVEPPYKARLDLFLANGETVIRAALVDDELRIPAGSPRGLVPPAELLWGALGVFRPGRATFLLSGQALADGDVRLTYRTSEGVELRYTLTGGSVREVERLRQGQVVERLNLTPESAAHYPAEATYRDLPAFRELQLDRERVELVEGYPPDIWEVGS